MPTVAKKIYEVVKAFPINRHRAASKTKPSCRINLTDQGVGSVFCSIEVAIETGNVDGRRFWEHHVHTIL